MFTVPSIQDKDFSEKLFSIYQKTVFFSSISIMASLKWYLCLMQLI